MAAAIVTISSCGGGSTAKSAKKASVSLDELDDYFTVKSYTLESNAGDLTPEQLGKVKGTLTLVIKRNETPMKYKPSDVEYATFFGQITSSNYNVFTGDCDAAIKKLMKTEPGAEETISLGFKGIDPHYSFRSDEDNLTDRQNAYDAITKPGCLDQILFDIEFKDNLKEAVQSLKDLAEDVEDMMDDWD